MHLMQQQQLNQMCPPPLGPPAWFINHPQHPSGLPPPSSAYHTYHQNYYNGAVSIPPSNHLNNATIVAVATNNSTLQSHHLHQHHPTQAQQYAPYPYTHQSPHLLQQPQNHNQQYTQLHNQQQQPLTIQQPQSQNVHQRQSPHIHQHQQPQLSPHTTQTRPSPNLHQHQQPSPNYQQHSPLNHHLTSPSLQPSPVLHHQPQQQPSPIGRHQSTPPHHTPTPSSQHHIVRPTSVKETPLYPSNILHTEVRVLEFNRRLQSRPLGAHRTNPLPNYDQFDDHTWWEEFMNDFFKDDATLTLLMQVDDKPVRYVLKRTLISRFFRSYFDDGVTELSINLKNSKELRGQQQVVLECEYANIITKNILKHPKVHAAPRVVVCTEGQLSLEFVGNNIESMLIKSWKFRINQCREYIDRSITAIGLPSTLLVEPTTTQGLPNSTMFYLRMCSIMEPMQELMTQHKMTNIEPKACLKKLLFDRYRFQSEDDNKAPVNKRRRRKPSPSTTASKKLKASNNTSNNPTNNVSPPVVAAKCPPLNIMIVGEPSCMSVEYHDDNERSITKVENPNHVPVIESISESGNIDAQLQRGDEDEEEKEVKEKGLVEEEIKHDEIIKQQVQQSQEDEKEETLPDQNQSLNNTTSVIVERPQIPIEEPLRQISEEPVEKENNSFALNHEAHTNSTATQSENHYNIMNSIPEDREDTCKFASCDSIVSKLPPSSNNKNTLTSNGTSNKQNRRRSSERKETLREGLMRTTDFVVAIKDLKCEHPALWRITSGNNLLQQFEPKTQNGTVLYENTNQYAGWNPEIKKDYVGVDVKITQHTRNQITVERLLLNFQKVEDAEAFYDKHFIIYLQILISTALDTKFWESIESEPKHHDYFLTSRRIIEDITKRYKLRLSNKLKLTEASLKNVEKYPNLLIKPIDKDDKEQLCRACNTNLSTQVVTFGNRSYDLHSYKPVKVTSELTKNDDKDLNNNLCETCLGIVKLYSDIHHIGWKLYNLAREKVDLHRTEGKPINAILDECLKDEDWLATVYIERDTLWSKVEHIQ